MDEKLKITCDEYLRFEDHSAFIEELEKLMEAGDEGEIRDRFYTQLAFGTGGLRGVIGAGYNRMNPYMVKRATQGLANYVNLQGFDNPSVAIAYDSRHYSVEFAESAALVLCESGIRAYLFSSLRPTPVLSFAVRQLGASAGIVITASHNPPSYNGYKVYWNDGGQVVSPHDSGILDEVKKVSGKIEAMRRDDALEKGLLEIIGEDIDGAYLSMVDKYLTRGDVVGLLKDDFSVVYTPLHGTGTALVEAVLSRMNVRYITVPEQREPDGGFPTVDSPNPEEAAALKMAISLARKEKADLVMATDPDADRLGVAVRNGEDFDLLSGNQLGSLLCDYVFSSRKEAGTLPRNPVLVKTIVTTELQTRIAASYGAKVYDVLTGFKYIGEKILEFEKTDEEYVFGGEESYGYLVETEVRDKDAVSTAALVVEMAAYDKSKGISLLDHLDDLYRRHGFFKESLVSKGFDGEEGKRRIEELMSGLRSAPPADVGGQPVIEVRDYSDGSLRKDGRIEKNAIDLPRSNVLQFVLPNAIFSARPSGTEPKIKFYVSCWKDPGDNLASDKIEVEKLIQQVEGDIRRISG
jgi:phosphoglucomutase